MSNGTLLTHLYVQLSKTTEGSNKFYNIHVAPCLKGELFRGSLKRSTQNGFEVYSIFGKINGTPRQRHIGFFFSEEAAIRSAERTKESKKQKGYTEHGNRTYVTSPKNKQKAEPKDFKPIFDPVPQVELKMTKTQKGRFSDLID